MIRDTTLCQGDTRATLQCSGRGRPRRVCSFLCNNCPAPAAGADGVAVRQPRAVRWFPRHAPERSGSRDPCKDCGPRCRPGRSAPGTRPGPCEPVAREERMTRFTAALAGGKAALSGRARSETARMNGLGPRAWRTRALHRIPEHPGACAERLSQDSSCCAPSFSRRWPSTCWSATFRKPALSTRIWDREFMLKDIQPAARPAGYKLTEVVLTLRKAQIGGSRITPTVLVRKNSEVGDIVATLHGSEQLPAGRLC